MVRRAIFFVGVLVSLLQVSVFALIDTAPSWRDVNDSSTTLSIWTFSNSTKSEILPDAGSYNIYGEESGYWYATVTPKGTERNWISVRDGASGIWALSGFITAEIPNTPVTGENTSKTVQVQLVWKPEAGYTTQAVDMAIGMTGYTETLCQTIEEAGATVGSTVTSLDNGWYQTIWTIGWPYNPITETITIEGHVYADSLIVDTICIPEPATMLILGLGAVLLRKKSR